MKLKKLHIHGTILVYIIPLLVIAWGLYSYFTSLPFYVKGNDPEYPYLINGLNCALLHFNRIGHTDHPGTPFQLFIGLIIRITYLFAGKESISIDVLQRPEFYFGAVSIALTILQAGLVLAIGKIGIKNNPLTNILILQLTPFYHQILLNLNGRCNPDRFLIIVTLLFIVVLLKYALNNKPNQLKLAIWSGVVMGLGFATKINYLPILILPLFLLSNWKHRGIYAGSGILSLTIFISPILQKFPEFRKFIVGIINHDGLYGAGDSQVFNIQKIIGNIRVIFNLNPELFLILAFILLLFVMISVKKPEKSRQYKLFLIGYFILFLIQLLMVAKHFKNYYLTPLFTTYGLFIFVVVLITEKIVLFKKATPIIKFLLPLIFLLISSCWILKRKNDKQIEANNNRTKEAALFVRNHINKNDYWFVEPTWESAPYIENAMAYGLSYCANRSDYELQLKQINPNIITYEGADKSIKSWRCSFASLDTVIVSGKKIHVLSTPSRHANELIYMIKTEAAQLKIPIFTDTIFKQPETGTYIIELGTNLQSGKLDSIQNLLNSKYQNNLSEFEKKVEFYKKQIKESSEWLSAVEKKAKNKGISLDSMIYLDAVYMANQK